MTTIHFLKDFDYRESDYLTIAYTKGMEIEVDDECAAEAVAKKAAVYSDFAEDDLFDAPDEDDA
jgi:hypothetical protein